MLKTIIELVIGDLLLAGFMVYLNNRSAKENEKQLEKQMNHLKEIIKLEFERIER